MNYQNELNEYFSEIDRISAEIRNNADLAVHKELVEDLKIARENLTEFETRYN